MWELDLGSYGNQRKLSTMKLDCTPRHRYALFKCNSSGTRRNARPLLSANDLRILRVIMTHLHAKGWRVLIRDEETGNDMHVAPQTEQTSLRGGPPSI